MLKLFDEQSFDALSPSAIIDAFVYLGNTDPNAWNQEQARLAQAAIKNVEEHRNVGGQTQNAQSMG